MTRERIPTDRLPFAWVVLQDSEKHAMLLVRHRNERDDARTSKVVIEQNDDGFSMVTVDGPEIDALTDNELRSDIGRWLARRTNDGPHYYREDA